MAWYDSFDSMVSADLESSFFGDSEFADSVKYFTPHAKPLTLVCQVTEHAETIVDGSHHQKDVAVIHVLVKDDRTTGIARAKTGDYVEWNDRVWNFHSMKSADLGARTIVFQETTINQFGTSKPPTV